MTEHTNNRIAALLERIGRLLTMEAHAEGLLPVHWETLRYVDRANRFSRAPAALTAYLGLTKGTVSQTLIALEAKGLVKKRVAQNDRRSRQLSLTAKGRGLLKHDPLRQTVIAIGSMTISVQNELEAALNGFLLDRLGAQNRQPFGVCRDCQYFARQHPDGEPHYCRLLNERLAEDDASAICFEQQPVTVGV